MPHVGLRAVALAIVVLVLFTTFLASTAMAWRIVSTRAFRGGVEACRKDYDFPHVHTLPSGVGRAPVAGCFNNGFTTIYPHSDQIGHCLVALEPEEKRDQLDPFRPHEEPKAIKILRNEYHCRFKGAGAVLGQSKGVRKTGTKVYFRGEEPTNFKTKDPGCKAIFDQLSSESDEYHHLISGR